MQRSDLGSRQHTPLKSTFDLRTALRSARMPADPVSDQKTEGHLEIPFFLFVLAIRTFVEIVRNFRDYSWYGELFLFREVFFLVMVCFVWVFVKAYYPFLMFLLMLVVVGIAMMLILSFFLFLTKASFKMSWFNSLSQRTKDTLTPLMALALFICCGAVITYFINLP